MNLVNGLESGPTRPPENHQHLIPQEMEEELTTQEMEVGLPTAAITAKLPSAHGARRISTVLHPPQTMTTTMTGANDYYQSAIWVQSKPEEAFHPNQQKHHQQQQ